MRAIAGPTALIFFVLCGCGSGEPDPSRVTAEGPPPDARTQVLEAGATLLQDKEPVDALNVYLDGFHLHNGDLQDQMEAHHYCSILTEDVRQCVIFDSAAADARLTGIEYVVSRRVFEQLPSEERKLWHSHVHEVKSGMLLAPGLPQAAEHELMEQMVDTYGKTWHTWAADRDATLPLGHPMLMAAFTADGQADPRLVESRDSRLGVVTAERRHARLDIATPAIVEGADAWQRGEVLQLVLQSKTTQPFAPTQESNRLDTAPDATSPAPPTRRIRANRGRELYAGLPALTADD